VGENHEYKRTTAPPEQPALGARSAKPAKFFDTISRCHVNLSKYPTNGNKLRNPIKQDHFPDLRSGRLSPIVDWRTNASTFDTILSNFDTILKS
jgi:hypothetical protein